MTERTLPCDIDAERAVVSACLLSPESLAVARDTLTAEQFFDPRCRLTFQAACSVDDSGSKPDVVTIACAMRLTGALEQIGGTPRLAELFEASPDLANVEHHCAIVADKYRLRRIITACRTHSVTAYGDVGPVADYCDRVEQDILAATEQGLTQDAPQTLAELLETEFPKLIEKQARGPEQMIRQSTSATRIFELDTMLWGGLTNNLYYLAGRPGMGKSVALSTFLLNIATGTLRNGELTGDGKAGVFFSLEMPKDQLLTRLLSAASGVSSKAISREQMGQEDWRLVTAAADRLSKLPISIQFKPGSHVAQVRSTFRREFARLKRKFGAEPGFGAVDYVQLLRGEREKNGNREQEVAAISRALMAMPAEFKCPIMAAAQLNRDLEKRPDKRPQLSDLRESGAIEQDGYGVFFLYRDELYHEESEAKGEAEIIVAKNRNGETGTVRVRFRKECVRFESMYQDVIDQADDLDNAIGG